MIVSLFQIDCNSVDCQLRYIDGRLATSLTVDCSGSTGRGSEIICPVTANGQEADCTIYCVPDDEDIVCSYTLIQNAAGGHMGSFKAICDGQQSCLSMEIALNPISMTNIDISCKGQAACRTIVIDIMADIQGSFTLNCTQMTSDDESICYDAEISVVDVAVDVMEITKAVLRCEGSTCLVTLAVRLKGFLMHLLHFLVTSLTIYMIKGVTIISLDESANTLIVPSSDKVQHSMICNPLHILLHSF